MQPAFEFGRRDIPQAAVGTFFVVAEHPGPADVSDLPEGREDVRVEHFFAEAAVEAFDVRILIRLAGLDVVQESGDRPTILRFDLTAGGDGME